MDTNQDGNEIPSVESSDCDIKLDNKASVESMVCDMLHEDPSNEECTSAGGSTLVVSRYENSPKDVVTLEDILHEFDKKIKSGISKEEEIFTHELERCYNQDTTNPSIEDRKKIIHDTLVNISLQKPSVLNINQKFILKVLYFHTLLCLLDDACKVPYCQIFKQAARRIFTLDEEIFPPGSDIKVIYQRQYYLPANVSMNPVDYAQRFQVFSCEKIACGGFGTIFRAFVSLQLQPMKVMARKAIKKAIKSADERNNGMLQLLNERRIDSPYILIPDIIIESGKYWISFMQLAAKSLQEYLMLKVGDCKEDQHYLCEHIPLNQVLRWLYQIAFGVKHLHELGFIHGDLKPDNTVITPEGNIKIIDLDHIQWEGVTNLQITGTHGYADPDIYESGKPLFVTDVHSLVLFIPAMLGLLNLTMKRCGGRYAMMGHVRDRNIELCEGLYQASKSNARLVPFYEVLIAVLQPTGGKVTINQFVELLHGEHFRCIRESPYQPLTDHMNGKILSMTDGEAHLRKLVDCYIEHQTIF